MKQYVKPELYLESFELSQHIAGCSLVLQSAEPETCTAQGEVRGKIGRASCRERV